MTGHQMAILALLRRIGDDVLSAEQIRIALCWRTSDPDCVLPRSVVSVRRDLARLQHLRLVLAIGAGRETVYRARPMGAGVEAA